MPTKDRVEWPYVVLLVGIVVMVAGAFHLLSAWVAFVIFAVLWVCASAIGQQFFLCLVPIKICSAVLAPALKVKFVGPLSDPLFETAI